MSCADWRLFTRYPEHTGVPGQCRENGVYHQGHFGPEKLTAEEIKALPPKVGPRTSLWGCALISSAVSFSGSMADDRRRVFSTLSGRRLLRARMFTAGQCDVRLGCLPQFLAKR
jgi:hypothetical protein